jgi:hypothetical protein
MKIPGFSPRWWLMVGIVGVLIRLFLWWFTIGTSDASEGFRLGQILYSQGVLQAYHDELNVNQPPPICIYAGQAWRWSGDDLLIFARLMKLWGLVGEGLALWALWRFAGPPAFAAYAWLPAAILVSGFHCNIDSLYAALLLVSAIAFDRERYFLSGLLMAAACNVKILPALLAPLLLIAAPSRKAFLRIAAALAIGVLPFVPFALAGGSAMFRNVVAYNSSPEHWGIPMLLRGIAKVSSLRDFALPMWSWFRAEGRYIVVASVLASGLLSRSRLHLPMTELMAIGGALFLVLAPGFGVQYVVLIAPLLCLVDLKAGIAWGWISGAFIGSVYSVFMFQWWPALSKFTSAFPSPTWIVGLAAWGMLVLFLWRQFDAASTRTKRPPGTPPSDRQTQECSKG